MQNVLPFPETGMSNHVNGCTPLKNYLRMGGECVTDENCLAEDGKGNRGEM